MFTESVDRTPLIKHERMIVHETALFVTSIVISEVGGWKGGKKEGGKGLLPRYQRQTFVYFVYKHIVSNLTIILYLFICNNLLLEK